MACDLNFVVKGEGLLKVIGSHVHYKNSNISETVLDRDVVTMADLTAAIIMTLSILEGHSSIASLFKCDILYLWCIMRSL